MRLLFTILAMICLVCAAMILGDIILTVRDEMRQRKIPTPQPCKPTPTNDNRCLYCTAIIPEGRWVCGTCEQDIKNNTRRI